MEAHTQPTRRVVATGFGMVTPLARGAEETFNKAAEGLSGIRPIRSFDTTGLPCTIGGEVEDAWLEALEPGRSDRLTGRGLRLLMAAADEAAFQARLDRVPNPDAVAVAVGSHGENPKVQDLELVHRFIDDNGVCDGRGLLAAGGYDVLQFLRRKPDMAAAWLAERLHCNGPCLSVSSACAAGTQAIGEAFRLIRDRRCDVAIAGGCESNMNFVGFIGFVLLRALAEGRHSPEAASRPFDRRRSGFVLSEGAGVIVLEELEHARARGSTILGEVLGYGDSADAYRITDTCPDGQGAVLAMTRALEESDRQPGDVDFVNAHGTSTVQGDLSEARALHRVFGPRAAAVPVSANKSMLGHTIAAAGAIEAVLTLIGLDRSIILPTINSTAPDPRCNLDVVPNGARRANGRIALSNSFGFGGQNACLCLARYDD